MPEPVTSRISPVDAVDGSRLLLRPGAIRAVFQPIVRLSDLQPIGYEGLARFPTPPGLVALPPDITLAAAARVGARDDLEVACWAAIVEAGAPPPAACCSSTSHRTRSPIPASRRSVGVAIAAAHESGEQVVARADAALYEVKRRGRDGVLLAPAP